VAASEGHIDSVKYLITHGANPMHRDFRDNTALDDAKREGHHEVIEYLESLVEHTPKSISKGFTFA
jgi:ankyrin repeat protein